MASLLRRAGVSLMKAQKMIHYSDPKFTANICTHASVEIKAEALAKFPDIEPFAKH